MLRIKDRSKLRQYSPSRLHNALIAVKDDGLSVNRASVIYSVPLTTLRDRVDGRIHIDTVKSGPAPLFNQEEEAKLVQHIKRMAAYGYGYSRAETINMSSDYAVYCDKRPKDKPLTNQWYYNFMGRCSKELKLAKPRALEASRAKSATREKVDSYFEELDTVLNKYNLADKPHRIFNIDEKGLNTDHKPLDVVSDKNTTVQSVTSGRSQTITLIAGGNAIGTSIPPFFVFPGKRMKDELLKGGLPGTDGTVSDSGWSNSEVFKRYLQEHFMKYAPSLDADNPLLIIYDGHASHVSLELIEWARENHIILHLLPAHCSHFLQPLDVACFGPFQKVYNRECQSYLRDNIGTVITRNEVCALASKAYIMSITSANLISGFRRSGIYPLNSKSFDESVLKPSEALKELKGKHEEKSNNNQQIISNKELDEDRGKLVDDFLEKRMAQSQKNVKTTEPRKTLSKITSGQTVTENEVFDKIVKFKEQSKSKPAKSKSAMKEKDTNSKLKRKGKTVATTSTKSKTQKIENSENCNEIRPSTSGLVSGAKGPLLVEDSYESDTDSETGDNIPCCMCNKRYPPALRHCISLIIMNWARCDKCDHWTHLRYCSPVTVVRRKSKFFCPHCTES